MDFPKGWNIPPPWERDGAEERVCLHLWAAWEQQNRNPALDAAAGGETVPSLALVHPGKLGSGMIRTLKDTIEYHICNHISEGNQAENQSKKLEMFIKDIFFSFQRQPTACLLAAYIGGPWSMQQIRSCFLAHAHLYPINTTPGGIKRYCLLILPLNRATQMVINASRPD